MTNGIWYTIMSDDDSHNYLVPKNRIKAFNRYVSMDWSVDQPDLPDGVISIDGYKGRLLFKDYKYDAP